MPSNRTFDSVPRAVSYCRTLRRLRSIEFILSPRYPVARRHSTAESGGHQSWGTPVGITVSAAGLHRPRCTVLPPVGALIGVYVTVTVVARGKMSVSPSTGRAATVVVSTA